MRGIACSCVVGRCDNSHTSGIKPRPRRTLVFALVESRVRRRRAIPQLVNQVTDQGVTRVRRDAQSAKLSR